MPDNTDNKEESLGPNCVARERRRNRASYRHQLPRAGRPETMTSRPAAAPMDHDDGRDPVDRLLAVALALISGALCVAAVVALYLIAG